MLMVMNKRGQDLTLGTVILIVLGIAVLVFLIFGFSSGWGNLWDRITNAVGGKANLDTIRSGCELACAQNSIDNWCNHQRTVRFPNEITIGGKKTKTTAGNCSYFVEEAEILKGLNVEPCPKINCPTIPA
jgi:hypothetical protein